MHISFLQRAVALAEQSVQNRDGGPFGAVVVRDHRMIGEGYNCVTSTNDPTAHAEIVAIRKACIHLDSFQLTDCTLYTSCEPCPMCLAAIYWARISKVYYANAQSAAEESGFDDAIIYQELMCSPEKRTVSMRRIDIPNAEYPFVIWKKMDAKIRY